MRNWESNDESPPSPSNLPPRQPTKPATPQRWQEALKRALQEGITVRQVHNSGMWIATSGTERNKSYELTVVNGIPHACSCPAGEFNDPVCKHRARFYYDAGLLEKEWEWA